MNIEGTITSVEYEICSNTALKEVNLKDLNIDDSEQKEKEIFISNYLETIEIPNKQLTLF